MNKKQIKEKLKELRKERKLLDKKKWETFYKLEEKESKLGVEIYKLDRKLNEVKLKCGCIGYKDDKIYYAKMCKKHSKELREKVKKILKEWEKNPPKFEADARAVGDYFSVGGSDF